MTGMTKLASPEQVSHFQQTLEECRELYLTSGKLIVDNYPQLLPKSPEHFMELMDNLHQALLVKIFVTICEADRRWSVSEKQLASILLVHLWDKKLENDELRAALLHISEKALSLRWYALVRPFDQLPPLREQVGQLETIAIRLANLVARSDGTMKPGEAAHVKLIQDELHSHLRAIPIDEPDQHAEADAAREKTLRNIVSSGKSIRGQRTTNNQKTAVQVEQRQEPPSPEVRLKEVLAELDQLVGLQSIKQEVRTLANFLKIQQHRQEAGLPTTNLSLHMVFAGNPGTAKTTVARIMGKLFGAMGILGQGHLVETDRSGLVAEYAGQTGPKASQKIDEALDGVLFIDEAYTLIADGDDPFGHEAVQTLLKRMEDDRQRLVVILAGYPNELGTLLKSNPGLSSRFSRNLEFADYSPLEMGRIFGLMCEKNHYQLRPEARVKTMVALDYLHRHRDRHFGNGRLSRNLFEHAIRRMANRIAEIPDLSVEQLTMLEAEDIEFANVPAEVFQELEKNQSLRFRIECPGCDFSKAVKQTYLGRQVRCPKCGQDFVIDWAPLVA